MVPSKGFSCLRTPVGRLRLPHEQGDEQTPLLMSFLKGFFQQAANIMTLQAPYPEGIVHQVVVEVAELLRA